MKTIIFLIGVFISTYTFAGTSENRDHYCAKMKEGKLTVMHNDKPLTADATLNNGTTVKMDGTIMKKDGSTVMLKDGECVDLDGKIMKNDNMKNENMKKENTKKKNTKNDNTKNKTKNQ
jgi:hypothetical protein